MAASAGLSRSERAAFHDFSFLNSGWGAATVTSANIVDGRWPMPEQQQSMGSDEAIAGRLRTIMQKRSAKVLTFFREWDADGSGTVTLKEFRRGIGHLGITASRERINKEFASFDLNGSGELELWSSRRRCSLDGR